MDIKKKIKTSGLKKDGEKNLERHIVSKGESYKSINHLAKSFNFPPKLLKGRIEKGWSEDRWFERDNRIVIFQKGYLTINALAKIRYSAKKLKGETGWPEGR